MKLTKNQMAILYQLIFNELGRVNRQTSPNYADSLQELELIFSKEYDKNRSL